MKVQQIHDFRGEVKGPVTLVQLEAGDEVTVSITDGKTRRHAYVVMWEDPDEMS